MANDNTPNTSTILKRIYLKPTNITLPQTNNRTTQNITQINSTISRKLSIPEENDDFYTDELDNPLKIKENILNSIRNLKPTLAGLDLFRSSTSDEDDSVIELNTTPPCVPKQSIKTPSVKSKPINLHTYIRSPLKSAYYIAPPAPQNHKTTILPKFTKISGKRGKEEALSNSSSGSSSDEDEQTHKPNQTNTQKLQQLLNHSPQISSIPLKLPIATNSLTFNNNLRQPHITPVISAKESAERAAAAAATTSTATTNSLQQQLQVITNEKEDKIDVDSLIHNHSPIFSSASSTASFSSINSITSPSSTSSYSSSSQCTNETFDFSVDDNSSTASGPIYIRQPGFEHHAHEIVLNKLNTQQQQPQPITKIATKKTTNKAKKKICTISSYTSTLNASTNNETTATTVTTNEATTLKPVRNKREPLPMRLRALPASFWQQPNQSHISPGTMYLPPLDLEDLSQKEIKISPANTDLLFKLFENIDSTTTSTQNQHQQQFINNNKEQLKLPLQRRLRNKPINGLSKALIKGEDPCIIDAVTEGLFPLLTLDSRYSETVHYLSINNKSDSTNSHSLPSLQLDQNYSQVLSEVVAAL